jgi:hypothetical protein
MRTKGGVRRPNGLIHIMFLSTDGDQAPRPTTPASRSGRDFAPATIETIQWGSERISTRNDHNLAASLGDWGAMGASFTRDAGYRGGASAREF